MLRARREANRTLTKGAVDVAMDKPPLVGEDISPLLPSHLPVQPAVMSDITSLVSGRRRQRLRRRRTAWRWAEWVFAAMGYVQLGLPKSTSSLESGLKTWQVSSRQTEAFLSMVDDLLPFGRLSESLDSQGRGIPKMAEVIKDMQAKITEEGVLEHQHLESLATTALEVSSDKVKNRFPKVSAHLDPAILLEGAQLKDFCQQDQWLDVEPISSQIPKACHMISVSE